MSGDLRKRIALYGIGALLLAGFVWAGFIRTPEPSYGQLVSSAEACAQYGLPDEGIRWAERALEIDPNDRFVHLVLAHCYLRKEDHDRAALCYQRSFDLTPVTDPNRELLVLYRAEAIAAGDRVEEAIRVTETVTERRPDLLAGWYTLGRLCMRQGMHDRARIAFNEAARRAPEDFEPLALLATLEEAQGNRDVARKQYREAELRLRLLSARKHETLGDAEPTMENLAQRQEMTVLRQKHVEILLGLARVHAADGASGEAEAKLIAAAGLDRRTTSRSIRTEELFAPYRDSERLRAALTGTAKRN